MSTASSNDEPNQDRRPHLVMAVGNLVVGDSRVEKAAITARDFGYKVTVVGIRRRTVQQVSFIDGDIPVIRPPVGNEHHMRVADSKARREEFLEKRRRQINGLPERLKRPAYIAHRIGVRSRDAGVKTSARFGRSWRTLWPHLVDYETTFFDAFKALAPDLIHVHDRHPLPGAAKYSRWADRTPGVRSVRWLYDAHEFVPTQHLPPPVEHQQAWIAVERECIQQADAVVTVTDKIADLIRRRHRLETQPTVVRNLPSLRQAEQNDLRTDVRSELGLAPNVPIAVYAGGITPQRGLGTLLDAQPMVPELHVAIICKNDVERRNALRAQAKKLGTEERLHFLDYVPASHVSRFISTADLGISALLPSPAHEEAAPTKVSEYLHAHLPVVVSDMRAQAERVRKLGFGAVYPSGDATAMAQVIQHVLSHDFEFKARITDDVILDNSWEADAPVLKSAWAGLAPVDRKLQIAPKGELYLSMLTTENGERESWGAAFDVLRKTTKVRPTLPRLTAVSGDLTDGRFMLSDDGLRFLEFWRNQVSQLSGVFYEEPISLVDGWDPALTTGILSMSQKPAVRILAGKSYFDVDRLRRDYPHHWLHEISSSEEERLRSEFHEIRQSIRENDRSTVTNCLTTAYSMGHGCTFVPSSCETVQPENRPESNTVRIGWFAGQRRSEAEQTAIRDLKSTVEGPVDLVEIIGDPTVDDLMKFNVFVDALSVDLPTVRGLRALSAGCVLVMGGMRRSSTEVAGKGGPWFGDRIPAVHASPDELALTVQELLEDQNAFETRRSNSLQFAARKLATTVVADRLLSLASVLNS